MDLCPLFRPVLTLVLAVTAQIVCAQTDAPLRQKLALNVTVNPWGVSSADQPVRLGSTVYLSRGDLVTIEITGGSPLDEFAIPGSAPFPLPAYPKPLRDGEFRSIAKKTSSLPGYFESSLNAEVGAVQGDLTMAADKLETAVEKLNGMILSTKFDSSLDATTSFDICGLLKTAKDDLEKLRTNLHRLSPQVQFQYPQSAGVMDYWAKAIDELDADAKEESTAADRALKAVAARAVRQFVYRFDGGAHQISVFVGSGDSPHFRERKDLLTLSEWSKPTKAARYVLAVGTFLDRLSSQPSSGQGTKSFDLAFSLKSPEFRKWLPLRASIGWGINPNESPRYTLGLSWRPIRANPDFWIDFGLETGQVVSYTAVYAGNYQTVGRDSVLWVPFVGISTRIWGF